MVFQPGDPKPANSGRKRGSPNKRTAELNAAMADLALRLVPKLDHVVDKAIENRGSFALGEIFGHFYRLVDRTAVAEQLCATKDDMDSDDKGTAADAPETDDTNGSQEDSRSDETPPHSN